jgi:cytochrome c biogenesis protein CcdA/thiol-disulfide isomerase/thioredoxin
VAELFAIAFLGGLITGISPCVIPVLPVVMAGGATGTNRARPFVIIGGLIVSFTLQEFIGATLLSALGLPQSFLRWFGIVVLFVLAAALLIPFVGVWIEKPFARLAPSGYATRGGGFILGLSLGLVFVPCAGPVYSAIAAATDQHHVSATLLFTALAYAIGAGVPLLILGLVAQRATNQWSRLRRHLPTVRKVSGVVLAATTLAIALGGFDYLQTHTPGFTSSLENAVENNVCAQLANLSHEKTNQFVARMQHLEGHSFSCTGPNTSQSTNLASHKAPPSTQAVRQVDVSSSPLPRLGRAPDFSGIVSWLNTPGSQPLSLAGLRGKVVLIDFWTYSCINCQRALPHVEGWYKDYKNEGLVVVGVSSPEFGFEHVISNVRSAAGQLGIAYPIAIDNNFDTWSAYNNEYWPAEYLVDQKGQVRAYDFGEGGYTQMERNIRTLLASDGAAALPAPTDTPDKTPTSPLTQETYVGYSEAESQPADAGVWLTPFTHDAAKVYHAPSAIPQNDAAFNGTWTDHSEEATAGPNASLRLHFTANKVFLVMGGQGTVNVSFNGQRMNTVAVHGVPTLYTLFMGSELQTGQLTLQFSPGVQAYDFTFG